MWAPVDHIATVTQLTGLDAIRLITMIVTAAERSRMHKDNCMKIAGYVQLIEALLVPLDISELRMYPETRAPLELLEDALRKCYILVNKCRDRGCFYLLAMGWNVDQKFREAEMEIERYLKLVPLIILVDRQKLERRERTERNQSEHVPDVKDNNLPDGSSSTGRSSMQRERRRRRRARTVTRNLIREVKYALACFKGEESKTEIEFGVDHNVLAFTLEELMSATEGFAHKNEIDCQTYKGMLNAMPIAVRRGEKGNDNRLLEDMKNVMNILSTLSHPNITKLLGYCNTKNQFLLVCEFVDNGSLKHHLFKRVEPLSWEKRIKIAIGTARAIQFLHMPENNVIHRDVNPSTILLDSDFNIKLSCFECSVHGLVEEQDSVETVVVGTTGYLDPQYYLTRQLNTKADVYAFGVVLLQLLSGQKPIDADTGSHLVERAADIILAEDKSIHTLVDPQLDGQYPLMAAAELGKLGLSCTSLDHESRPCMEEIVKALEAIDRIETST